MEPPFFEIPILFSILCFYAGSLVLLVPFVWLYRARRAAEESVSAVTVRMCLRAVFTTLVAALIYGLWNGEGVSGRLAEIILIALMVCVFGLQARAWEDLLKSLKLGAYECTLQFFVVFRVIMFYGLVIIIWHAVMIVFGVAGVRLSFEVPIFLIAAVFVLALYLYYKRTERAQGELRYKFYDLLWPFVFGLSILILPLWLNQLAHDPKMYNKFNPPPRIRAI